MERTMIQTSDKMKGREKKKVGSLEQKCEGNPRHNLERGENKETKQGCTDGDAYWLRCIDICKIKLSPMKYMEQIRIVWKEIMVKVNLIRKKIKWKTRINFDHQGVLFQGKIAYEVVHHILARKCWNGSREKRGYGKGEITVCLDKEVVGLP